MLRRKPTAITVTSEDLAAFEDARLRKLAKENSNQANIENSPNTHFDPSDELKPLPGDKARIVRSREERIGIRRRNWVAYQHWPLAGKATAVSEKLLWTYGSVALGWLVRGTFDHSWKEKEILK